ncbi:hydantoinase B/oxoprolinase family protein [Paracoccus yeei]|uniref:Hydantoinase B/oxoprolinase family protein n=1 Tax=Paracoccus yeei TaxID=147645 RepID=A0A386UKG9_9RHOB|nr:hydantoinase B/oxoprolinase family protein [Paracoccus yeei]AYF00818.1 N-methylhydantoinase B [Paracoccus yeei]MBY0137704.1 hydantoinase B/oxoprolinase family protein [Paracoccus yeei]QEU08572.1 hydantoinase B/oxoprolinase family protein [Paracoccus yeei]
MSGVDPIRLEVMKNAFDAIADEMALMLMRAAYSPIVRDSMDYSTAICDAKGQTLAQGVTTPMHLGSFYDAMQHLMRRYDGNIRSGDVFIGNDPYAADGQHLPDIYIIEPIFHDGRLVAWTTTLAHHADVGGIVPGSNALGAEEIYQEGLRLPFLKLCDAGVMNHAIWEVIGLNVRVPEMVHGDLRAQMAASHAGRRAFLELVARHDIEQVLEAAEQLHDYAERLGRAEIGDLPNGTYCFTDHMDGLGEDPQPILIQLAVTIHDSSISVDFTGSSPQVAGGVNTPLPFTKASVYTALRSVMQSDIPNCHGFERVVTVTAPKGTVVNSVHPAPCGARGITGYRVIDAMFGALAQALPDRVTADGMGGSTVPTFAGTHAGRAFVFTETVMGTWGASAEHDGQVGVPHMGANQANVPVEMIEASYPLRIRRYGIMPDTGGSGRYRGGNAFIREYEYLGEQPGLMSLRSDKRTFRPHGLFGGAEGTGPVSLLIQGERVTELPVLVTKPYALKKGDVFRHISPSGGGYGEAKDRPRAEVLADIEAGLISAEVALRDYGVTA